VGIVWEFRGNCLGIVWELPALIFNELRLFMGIVWELFGNCLGISWEFGVVVKKKMKKNKKKV